MKNACRRRCIILLALDIAMISAEIYALGVSWAEQGVKMFRYYTQDSNLLALIVCIICGVEGLKCLCKGKILPAWMRRLRYCCASCLMLTLLVSGLLLAPMDKDLGFSGFMLEGKYLYLHTICPAIGIVQLFVQPGPRFHERHALGALVPTVIYAAILLAINAAGVFSGPYPFLRIREQEGYVTAVGCIAVLGVAYASARILAALTCLGRKKRRTT